MKGFRKFQLDLSVSESDWKWENLERYISKDKDTYEFVKRAYEYASKCHKDQKRDSGQTYLVHPVWIAKVVAQLELGKEAIATALLHDVVEDTSATIDDVAKEFGDEVALLVDGLTNVKKKTDTYADDAINITLFRRLLFSSIDDVRILIIRIVDQVNNALTVESLTRARQIRFAKRVFSIYGPVSEYVGLHQFKKILEDKAFKVMYPDKYAQILEQIKLQQPLEEKLQAEVKNVFEKLLKNNHLGKFEIQSRVKSVYGSYLKQLKTTKWLQDRVGARIILGSVSECYTVLGLLHAKYRYVPESFDDYISHPKPNGYRSIQTTLLWDNDIQLEVQIRTEEMHEFAEYGPSCHIAYKFGSKENALGFEWVKKLTNWVNHKSVEDSDKYRVKVLQENVYVFTPKGDVRQLPLGASVLDFAFAVHSDVGLRAKGAVLNNKMVKLDTKLKTGDMVKILLSPKINVSRDWLTKVVTSHAKTDIRRELDRLNAIY